MMSRLLIMWLEWLSISVRQSITSSERLTLSPKYTSDINGTIYYIFGTSHFAAGTSEREIMKNI